MDEKQPLLAGEPPARPRRPLRGLCLFATLLASFKLCFLCLSFYAFYVYNKLPSDPHSRAIALLERHPLIDAHIDTPIQIREHYANQIDAFNFDETMPGHVDIPRLRKGRVGAVFWSVYVGCPKDVGLDEGPDFTLPTDRVRDTLEQIDITKLLVEKYSDTFELATTAKDLKRAFKKGKIASLMGMEGAHQISNSIAVVRQMYDLGVRYMTLTHGCNNAFADSCGYNDRRLPVNYDGLSDLGKDLVREMNRIGMIVDISHTSADTAMDVLDHSLAPAIFSHSNANSIYKNVRNVPDHVLQRYADADAGNSSAILAGDGLVAVTFAPYFVKPGKPNLLDVVEHIEHIAKIAGKRHIAFGSDWDGVSFTTVGLESVDKYPDLIAELIRRGWSDDDVIAATGGNFLRIMEKVEKVAKQLQAAKTPPATTLYVNRTDLPWHEKEL